MISAKRIVFAQRPDTPCRLFFSITKMLTDTQCLLPLPIPQYEDLSYLEDFAIDLLRRIAAIPGCEMASLGSYSLVVDFAPAFYPEKELIVGEVIRALKECFGTQANTVQVFRMVFPASEDITPQGDTLVLRPL